MLGLRMTAFFHSAMLSFVMLQACKYDNWLHPFLPHNAGRKDSFQTKGRAPCGRARGQEGNRTAIVCELHSQLEFSSLYLLFGPDN